MEGHRTHRTGDPVPETAESKLIREAAKRGFKSHAFAAAYGTKYRLNPLTLQWYPAEPEYDIMGEKPEYFARLLGEPAVSVNRDPLIPHRVVAKGVLGTMYTIDTLSHQIQVDKVGGVNSEKKETVDCKDNEPTTNPGAENWEKIFGSQVRATGDAIKPRQPKTARELLRELEATVAKKMRGLAALVYEAERCGDEERRECMEAILRETINSFRRRAFAYIG
jgi:hypothetical protein